MADQKQVLDVKVSKGITAAQSNEHLRDRSERAEKYAMNKGNYDPTRKHLNFEIAPGGKVRPIDTSRNIPERMADILERRGIKDPNEGLAEPKYRTVVNFIFGGSRERMHELAFGTQKVDFEKDADNTHIKRMSDIERWAKDVYSFVSGKYGEQNIAAFIVHLDELNPHVHCTLLPIKDGRFAYKEIFAGKDKFEYSARMKQLHTDFFAEVNTRWGMSRGTSISETGARHRTTEEYRRMLSEECTTIEENISRYQVKNMTTKVWDATVSDESARETADVLIADLPCSGLGVLRKKTDIRYKMSRRQQEELEELQRRILDTVCSYVRKDGIMVYSTCTINPGENQENVAWFLGKHPEFELLDMEQIYPGAQVGDGFFYAKLKRIS